MAEDEEYTFSITLMHALNLSNQYPDVFCQFNFLHRHEEAFSTEPVKNHGNGILHLSYVQNLTLTMSKSFLHYVYHYPIMFELFGHYQPNNNGFDHNVAAQGTCALARSPSAVRIRSPPSLIHSSAPLNSTPIKSQKTAKFVATDSNHIRSKYDILVYFEICELASSGKYVPAFVDHGQQAPMQGVFWLHQGIQRRLRVTLCHEKGEDLRWTDCKELVVGRIRNTIESSDEDTDTLSLPLFNGHYIEYPNDDQIFFQFEAAWDSSLHDSPLLNRVTQSNEQVFMTVSAYMELDLCCQPAVFTKDLCVYLYSRDSKISAASRTLKILLSGTYKNTDTNRLLCIYSLVMKENSEHDSFSPGAQQRT